MIELLGGLAALLGVLLVVAVVFAAAYRRERDEALTDAETLQAAKDSLALSLKAAELNAEKLTREKGRIEGELVAANQRLAKFERPRGAKGKFAAKQAPKPKPIACA
jgi:hypothetical protein